MPRYPSPLQRLRRPTPVRFAPGEDLEMDTPELSLDDIGTGGGGYVPRSVRQPQAGGALDWEAFGGGRLPEYRPAPDPDESALDAELYGGWNEPRSGGLRGLREPSAPQASQGAQP